MKAVDFNEICVKVYKDLQESMISSSVKINSLSVAIIQTCLQSLRFYNVLGQRNM